MSIMSVTAKIECDSCEKTISVELTEIANGIWGDADDVTLPDGWERKKEYGYLYSHYCPGCQ